MMMMMNAALVKQTARIPPSLLFCASCPARAWRLKLPCTRSPHARAAAARQYFKNVIIFSGSNIAIVILPLLCKHKVTHCSCRQTAPRAGCCNPVLVAPHARPACRICNPSECGPDTLRALVKNSKTQGCWLPAAYCPMLRPCDTCFRRAKSKHKCHPSCVSVRCTRMAGDVRAWSWRLPAFNLDSTQELP
jgi:hypothetical protein